MVRIDPGGGYITYVAVNGAGYVKVLKPESKRAASAVDETAQEFDYVEHLNIGLNSVDLLWYQAHADTIATTGNRPCVTVV